jgi:hypothetical protein
MRRSLALVADNAPEPPREMPGYRNAIAAGVCQHCRVPRPGVQTIGMRRRDDTRWKRLALCAACIAVAREQGYPVIS